jgi:hypothetical protein
MRLLEQFMERLDQSPEFEDAVWKFFAAIVLTDRPVTKNFSQLKTTNKRTKKELVEGLLKYYPRVEVKFLSVFENLQKQTEQATMLLLIMANLCRSGKILFSFTYKYTYTFLLWFFFSRRGNTITTTIDKQCHTMLKSGPLLKTLLELASAKYSNVQSLQHLALGIFRNLTVSGLFAFILN